MAIVDAPERQPFRLGYRPALDGVRAIAIVGVMAFHAGWPVGRGGYLGVDVFFALSGFLITALLLEERHRRGRVDLPAFWARRALRLLPALVVFLAATAVWVACNSRNPVSAGFRTDALAAALYVANWAQALAPTYHVHVLSHTWSLGIEEQFYVLWPPLVAFVLVGTRRRPIVAVTAAMVLASIAVRAVLFHVDGPTPRVTYGLDTRATGLLVGCLLAVGVQRAPVLVAKWRRATSWIGGGGLVVLVWALVGPRYTSAAIALHPARVFDEAYLLVPLATCAVIAGVLASPAGPLARVLSLRPVVWLGRISYGVYLWHFPVDLALAPAIGLRASVGLQVLRVVVALGLAAASYALVERPFLRLKDRFSATRSGRAAEAHVAVAPLAGA
jgi:peptidoglycan/LPS O-acetylase OafA/YrhL